MSWLARSIANSLNLDDDEQEEGGAANEEENTPHDAAPTGDRPRDSDGDAAPDNCGDEDLDGDDNRRGMKEDLSELKDSFARQLWGVASFLAPPPPPPPPPPPLYYRSGSARFKSKSDEAEPGNGDREDELAEREESESGQFGDYYENVVEDATGITEEVLAFARNIAHHPETWLDFPLSEEDEFDDFDISDAQYKHAVAVEHLSPRLAALRYELCPVHMSDGYFWMVYFVLLHSRLNKHDADLLSSPQLAQARVMWMQELQKQTKEESSSSWLRSSTLHSKESSESPRHVNLDGYFENVSEPTSPVESSIMHRTMAGQEFEKCSVSEIEFVDKSVIKEDLAPEPQEKEVIVSSSSFKIPVHDNYEDEDDDWLKEDSDLIGYSGLSIVGNEEDISFSDLEDDLDSTMPIKYKMEFTKSL